MPGEPDQAALLAAIAERLDALDAEDRATATDREAVELDQARVGRLSRMDALQVQAMAQAQSRRRRAERERLLAARRRAGDGELGYCQACGEAIAPGRLRIDPAAARCADCVAG